MGIVHNRSGFSVILFEAFVSCNHDKLADSIEFTNAKFLLQGNPAISAGSLPIVPHKSTMTSAKSLKAENTTHMSIQNMRRINQSLSTPTTTCPTQSDLSEKVSRRDTDWAYSKCPLSTKSTTSTTTTPAGESMLKSTTIADTSYSKEGVIINEHSQHGLLTPDSCQSTREDRGIIRSLMKRGTSMENVQVSSISIFIFM